MKTLAQAKTELDLRYIEAGKRYIQNHCNPDWKSRVVKNSLGLWEVQNYSEFKQKWITAHTIQKEEIN